MRAEHRQKAERYLAERGGKAVFLGRFTAALRVLIPGLAGLARMRYRTFAIYNIAGGATWATGMVLAAAFLAIRLVSALYPSDAPFDPPAPWWGTPFGRAVARRAGHPGSTTVPVSVAAAMLGITRQGVHDLLRRRKLDRTPDGAITTASIQARLTRSRRDHPAAGTRSR